MRFTDKDKLFFSIILKYGTVFEEVVKQSYNYTIKMETALRNNTKNVTVINKTTNSKHKFHFTPYCKYDEATETFSWLCSQPNAIFQYLYRNGDIENKFIDTSTIEKLFSRHEMQIPIEYKKVVPYLIAIIMLDESIIPFSSPTSSITMYIGIKMKLSSKFDLHGFKKELKDVYNGKDDTL